jgi:hypothetical protein
MGGRLVSSDVAKELSPEYVKDRTLSSHVHKAAGNFATKHYADILSRPVPEGQKPFVVFTGGGSGAGKSSGLILLGNKANTANAIYDTTLSDFKSSVNKIEAALKANRSVVIAYTYRDPVEAFKNGVLTRAMTKGRTVPMEYHIESHINARKTISDLAEHYKDNQNVVFLFNDNSFGEGGAKSVPLDRLPTNDHIEVRKGVEHELEQAYSSGAISREVFEATRSHAAGQANVARATEGLGASGGARNDSYTERERSGPSREEVNRPEEPNGHQAPISDEAGAFARRSASEGLDPAEKAHIDAALSERPDMAIPVDGEVKPAAEAITEANQEVAKAEADAPAFDAAVTCFLRG